VLIFSDEEMPLSTEQANAIQSLFRMLVLSVAKSMWGSNQIADLACLWISRRDSNDVIARSIRRFLLQRPHIRAVSRSKQISSVGIMLILNIARSCYFFRTGAKKINEMLNRESIENILSEISTVVEDIAAFHFAKRLGLKTWLTHS
jgi:hypothetical protein